MGKPKRSIFTKIFMVLVLIVFSSALIDVHASFNMFVLGFVFVFLFLWLLTIPKDVKRRRLSFDELTKVISKRGGMCDECGADKNLSVDHIRPLSKGGTNELNNLRVLCRRCNSRKKDKW